MKVNEDITVEELKFLLDENRKFKFIDVREPKEYKEFYIGAQAIPVL